MQGIVGMVEGRLAVAPLFQLPNSPPRKPKAFWNMPGVTLPVRGLPPVRSSRSSHGRSGKGNLCSIISCGCVARYVFASSSEANPLLTTGRLCSPTLRKMCQSGLPSGLLL